MPKQLGSTYLFIDTHEGCNDHTHFVAQFGQLVCVFKDDLEAANRRMRRHRQKKRDFHMALRPRTVPARLNVDRRIDRKSSDNRQDQLVAAAITMREITTPTPEYAAVIDKM